MSCADTGIACTGCQGMFHRWYVEKWYIAVPESKGVVEKYIISFKKKLESRGMTEHLPNNDRGMSIMANEAELWQTMAEYLSIFSNISCWSVYEAKTRQNIYKTITEVK